jgi:hypothetical protein
MKVGGDSMGFQIGRSFSLEFEDTDADGAVVKVRSASVATIVELRTCPLVREAEIVAEHVTEWNLEDGEVPVPITADGVMSLEEPFKNLIINEWLKATRAISVPFDRRSSGGVKPPEEELQEPSIPMVDL